MEQAGNEGSDHPQQFLQDEADPSFVIFRMAVGFAIFLIVWHSRVECRFDPTEPSQGLLFPGRHQHQSGD